MNDIILGIDLGTINSCAALLKNNKVTIIPDLNGDRIIPSMICYNKNNDEFLYGQTAKNNSLQYAESTMFESKKIIGQIFKSKKVQKDISYLPIKIIEDTKTRKPKYIIEEKNGIKEYFPEEVSSMILKYIINYCQVYNNNKKIEKAIITVPTHFNQFQKQATINAGKLAGLKDVILLNEATAAAIAYNNKFNSDNEIKILVFDIGADNFNVSILSFKSNKYKVLSSSGINYFNEDNFNQLLLNYIINEVKKNDFFKDINFNNPKILKRFRKEVEKIKIELSQLQETLFLIESLKNGEDFTMKISRIKYEELCMKKWKEMFIIVDKALKIAKINKKELNYIILVGGATRTPKIEEMIKNYFGNIEILKSINVEEVVAYGAALSGNQNLIVEDSISKSIGIEIANKEFSIIIPMGTPLPTLGKNYKYMRNYNHFNNSRKIKIRIFEGNSKNIIENDYLGGFILNLDENDKFITIKMKIDHNSILYVAAIVNGIKKRIMIIDMKPINQLDLINLEF